MWGLLPIIALWASWFYVGLGAQVAAAAPCPSAGPLPRAAPGTPNVILILLDDLDLTLGGLNPLTKTRHLLADKGANASNCCPSRAELLTGRYFHNVKVPQLSDPSCMHVFTDPAGPFDSWLFAQHLRQAGVTVGLFGKYLNNDVPLCPPQGVAEDGWLANNGGSYNDPSFNYNGQVTHFDNRTYAGYSTSVIGNISVAWIAKQLQQPHPFMAYIAPKAPHIEDGPGWPEAVPPPWYADNFPTILAPRTPNYNASCADHHWLVAQQPPMTAEQAAHSDSLYRSRWRSLLAVDDLVEAVLETVEQAGALNNTYILFTSDHGYRFGQFRMPQGKWNVYENDIHIPLMIRGPGVKAQSTFDLPGTNVDIMPTILGLAGVDTPATMDGRSIVPFLVDRQDSAVPAVVLGHIASAGGNPSPWRPGVLIEYYGLGDVVRYQHLEDTYNNTFRALRLPSTSVYGNLLLAEFTDIRSDYNFTKSPQFYELFNLTADSYQLENIYRTASPDLISKLHEILLHQFSCRGTSCW